MSTHPTIDAAASLHSPRMWGLCAKLGCAEESAFRTLRQFAQMAWIFPSIQGLILNPYVFITSRSSREPLPSKLPCRPPPVQECRRKRFQSFALSSPGLSWFSSIPVAFGPVEHAALQLALGASLLCGILLRILSPSSDVWSTHIGTLQAWNRLQVEAKSG